MKVLLSVFRTGELNKAARLAHGGLLLFLALFSTSNLLGEIFWRGADNNEWWLWLSSLPRIVRQVLFGAFTLSVFAYLFKQELEGLWKAFCIFVFSLTGGIAIFNGFVFYLLLLKGNIHAELPLPLSWIIAPLLFLAAYSSVKCPIQRPLFSRKTLVGGFAFSLLLFPLLQMVFFGKTDYRRPADAVLVFGARVYADGTLSDALRDRVRTGCELYRQGFVSKLIFSGGPGEGATDEPQAMKNFAKEFGVPETAIILDHSGLNTQASVKNTLKLCENWHLKRLLCVSHAYHLPRVKLAFQRTPVQVFTVPARESYFLGKMPLFMLREAAALVKYYFLPVAE